MKSAIRSKSRDKTMWIDASQFRAHVLKVSTPPRKRIVAGTGEESLRSLVSSFEPTADAIYTEARRSLSSAVTSIALRVVSVPLSTGETAGDNSRVFCVAPLCVLPSGAVLPYETVCDKAIHGRHKVTRGLSPVTNNAGEAGDRFVFNDCDPGAPHAGMTPSIVILRTVVSKVSVCLCPRSAGPVLLVV